MSFRFPDAPKPSIDLGLLLSQPTELLLDDLSFPGCLFLVPLFMLAEYSADAGFQRPLFLKSTAKQVDTERTQVIWNKSFKNLKRTRCFGSDEGSLPRGKQMTD